MYTRRLRERTRRKHVIRDYQLVSQFFKKERGTLREGNRARRRFYEYEKLAFFHLQLYFICTLADF